MGDQEFQVSTGWLWKENPMEKKNLKSLKSHGICCCCFVNVALSICETADYSLPFAYLGLLASYASSQWAVSNGKKKKYLVAPEIGYYGNKVYKITNFTRPLWFITFRKISTSSPNPSNNNNNLALMGGLPCTIVTVDNFAYMRLS